MTHSNDLATAFVAATRYHVAGDVAAAGDAYRRLLHSAPRHADALHQLGVLNAQAGDFAGAVECLRQAVDIEPTRGAFQVNLANALKDAGRPAEAVSHYLRAVDALPAEPLPLSNLGNTYLLLGDIPPAIDAYRRALAFTMDRAAEASVRSSLGLCLSLVHRAEEALAELNASLRLVPDRAETLQHMGLLMLQRGSLRTALEACDQSLQLDPGMAPTHNIRGLALNKLQLLDDAVAAFGRAVELDPANPRFHDNLANCFLARGEHYQAIAAAERVRALAPDLGGSSQILGGLFLDLARHDDAAAAFDRAVAADPDDAGPASGRIFAEQFHPGRSAADLAVHQRAFDARFGRPLAAAAPPHRNDRSPHRRLRVGYISPNFNNHVLALLMMPLFTHHDRDQVELWLYADVANPVPNTARFGELATTYQSVVGRSDEQVARLIRDDGMDVLVDLTMHMADNRMGVFARRAAPVQVTWCYPGSTGLTAMDYRISDPHLDPPGLFDAHYAERTVRLPDTFFCYDPMLDLPPVAPPPHASSGTVTFGCLNNFCKVNAGVLDVWGRVLAAVPGSRLALLSPGGDGHRRWVERELARHGVDAGRVEHVDRRPRREYMRLYDGIDVCLDTFPYNGHTTSLDAFYMGVPVVTLVGGTVVGRAGLGQLTNLGLPELIAGTPDQYVRIAADLAAQPGRMTGLRSTLRDRLRASPLMDGTRFARGMEAAYRQMWQDWCAGPA